MNATDFLETIKIIDHLLEQTSDRLVDSLDQGSAILAEIKRDPRLNQAYSRLVVAGYELRRKNILIGNSSVEDKLLFIDDDAEDIATIIGWVEDVVRNAYRENEDLRLQATLEKGLVIFDRKNGLTDLESMAQLYDWATWFWVDRMGNGDLDNFTSDMVRVFSERSPNIILEKDEKFNILDKRGTRDGSTGFKREFRDEGAQVRHATLSLRAAYKGFLVAWLGLQLREFREMQIADLRLNNACLGIMGSIGGTINAPQGIGAILREKLGDPNETLPYSGDPGGYPD
jgi:hypothetical protein